MSLAIRALIHNRKALVHDLLPGRLDHPDRYFRHPYVTFRFADAYAPAHLFIAPLAGPCATRVIVSPLGSKVWPKA